MNSFMRCTYGQTVYRVNIYIYTVELYRGDKDIPVT